jgi:hypothetical protein
VWKRVKKAEDALKYMTERARGSDKEDKKGELEVATKRIRKARAGGSCKEYKKGELEVAAKRTRKGSWR